MQNKKFRFGPIALTSTLTTNLLNPPTASGGTNGGSSAQIIYLRHIRLVNKTGSDATVTLYLGATGANAAGTEILVGKNVPANDYIDLPFGDPLVITSSDFLVGGASANTTITIIGHGEIGVAG